MPLGVSEIKLTDAINITNNDLEVNLGGFVLAPLAKILLFDGDQALATNRIFGTFANVTVNGNLNPANYTVVYDQPIGDIQLQSTRAVDDVAARLRSGHDDLGEASGIVRDSRSLSMRSRWIR